MLVTRLLQLLLAICRPSGCTVVSGVVVGICNRSQMRTSKCTFNFGVSIVLTLARNAQKEFLIGQIQGHMRHITDHLQMASTGCGKIKYP